MRDGRVVARLRLGSPVGAADGDRLVLRRGSGAGSVIGGTILDARPPTGPSRRRVDPARLAGLASSDPLKAGIALVAIHGILEPDRLASRNVDRPTGPEATRSPVQIAGWLVDRELAESLEARALVAVAASADDRVAGGAWSRAEVRSTLVLALRRAATAGPAEAGSIVDAILAGLLAAGRLGQTGTLLHPPGREIGPAPQVLAAMDRLERLLASPAPPSLSQAARDAGCPAEGIRALESSGRIVRLDDDLAYAASTYADLAQTAVRMAAVRPLSPAAFRDATGTSRRYVLAILEDLDRRGVLQRSAAGHVPGPRVGLVASFGTGR